MVVGKVLVYTLKLFSLLESAFPRIFFEPHTPEDLPFVSLLLHEMASLSYRMRMLSSFQRAGQRARKQGMIRV